MGIRIKKLKVLIDTFDYEPVYPGNILPIDDVLEYEAHNPFPETEEYTRENMLDDMQHTHAGGILTFHEITEEQEDWIEGLLN